MKRLVSSAATCAILLAFITASFGQSTPSLVTMHNAATATANGTELVIGQSAAVPSANLGAVGIQITGTFSGTVTFEASSDGTNWTPIMATNLADDARATTATAAGHYTMLYGSAIRVRARISAYSSGTITVKGRLIPGLTARVTSGGGGGGGVTSVAQSFTGGLISVGGSPITTSGTLALTVAGTSGGVPYFSSASTWASSNALAANALVIGGGAGAAPSTTTTAAGILTFLGTPSSANLVSAVTDETGSGALVFGTSPTISSLNAASTVSFGTGTGTGRFTGVICASAATATTSGTTEETVATCTIPANSMSADAKGVRVTAFLSTAATTNNKTIKLQYGATVLQTVTKNTTSGSVKLEAIVLRDGATSQKGFSRQFWTLAGTWIDDLQNFTTPAETLSGSVDLTIKLTTATAAAGASLLSYVVEFIN